ncbi:hypothetical protein Tco_0403963 [Tanacetum coccineum]
MKKCRLGRDEYVDIGRGSERGTEPHRQNRAEYDSETGGRPWVVKRCRPSRETGSLKAFLAHGMKRVVSVPIASQAILALHSLLEYHLNIEGGRVFDKLPCGQGYRGNGEVGNGEG